MLLPANTIVSHYRILSRIGAGGMGDVYLAEDTSLGRRVALKLLPEPFNSDEARLRRFEQEARAASALNHPNIITIHEVGSDEGTRFIATEFIEGETVRQRLKHAAFGLREAIDVAIQVARALAAAHRAGIVHRDSNRGLMIPGKGHALETRRRRLAGRRAIPPRSSRFEAIKLQRYESPPAPSSSSVKSRVTSAAF